MFRTDAAHIPVSLDMAAYVFPAFLKYITSSLDCNVIELDLF